MKKVALLVGGMTAAVVALFCTPLHAQTTTYTYTGQPFTSYDYAYVALSEPFVPTPCALSSSITVSHPIPANFSGDVYYDSFTLTDCVTTVTSANGDYIEVSTDGKGRIVKWLYYANASVNVPISFDENRTPISFQATQVMFVVHDGGDSVYYYRESVVFSASAGNATGGSWTGGSGGCGDERDQIIAEYQQSYTITEDGKQVSVTPDFVPQCSNFTKNASSQYFGFSALNSGDYSWALVRTPLVSGYLDAWINNQGGGPARPINSGYRNPAHNFNVAKSTSPGSRHMHGDAIDLRNITQTVAEHQFLDETALATGGPKGPRPWVEPLSGPCKLKCVHADWRDTNPGQYAP